MKEVLTRQPELVSSCAWCVRPGTEKPLPKGFAYTHVICKNHLAIQLAGIKQRRNVVPLRTK